MKRRYYSLILLSGMLFLAYSFIPSRHAVSNFAASNKDTNYLAVYGQYIFTRENCLQCHTLDIGSDSQLVSLDGVGQKFSSRWHFLHLREPSGMRGGSKMQSYAQLIPRPLNRDIFKAISGLLQDESAANQEAAWQKMISQSGQLEKELEGEFGPVQKRTEIMALICYLQSIPSSKEKQRRDSIIYSELKKQQSAWDSLSTDTASVIYVAAADLQNIEKGKALYQRNFCSACHGNAGEGGVGPNLTDDYWINGNRPADIARVIINGNPDKGMPPGRSHLQPAEIGKIMAYIASIRGSNPPNAKMAQGIKEN